MGKLLDLETYRVGRAKAAREKRWADQDAELERYCLVRPLRYGGNLGDGGHRTKLPTMGQQESGSWGRDR